jgi:hypothetical protein
MCIGWGMLTRAFSISHVSTVPRFTVSGTTLGRTTSRCAIGAVVRMAVKRFRNHKMPQLRTWTKANCERSALHRAASAKRGSSLLPPGLGLVHTVAGNEADCRQAVETT